MPKEKQGGLRGAMKKFGEKTAVALGIKPWIERNAKKPSAMWFRRFMRFLAPAAITMGIFCLLPHPVFIPLLGGIVAGAGVAGIVYATVMHFKDKKKAKAELSRANEAERSSEVEEKSEIEHVLGHSLDKSRGDVDKESRVSEWVKSQNFDTKSTASSSSFDSNSSDSEWDTETEISETALDVSASQLGGSDSESILDGDLPLNFSGSISAPVGAKEKSDEKAADGQSEDEELSVNNGKFTKDLQAQRKKLKRASKNNPFKEGAVGAKVVVTKSEPQNSKAEARKLAKKEQAEVVNGRGESSGDESIARTSIRASLSSVRGGMNFEETLRQLLAVVPKAEPVNAEGVKSNFGFEGGNVNVKETEGSVKTEVNLASGKTLVVEEFTSGRYTIKATGDKGENVVLHGTGSGLSKDSLLEDHLSSKARNFSGEKFNSHEASEAKEFLTNTLKEAGAGLKQLTQGQISGILQNQGSSKSTLPVKGVQNNLVK